MDEFVAAALKWAEEPTNLGVAAGVLAFVAYAAYWMRIPKRASLRFPSNIKDIAEAVKFPEYKIPQKCLVTGGSGFLGRHLVDALVEQGAEVVVFDIRASKFESDSVQVVVGDLCDQASIQAALREHDIQCVFHVASPPPHLRNTKLFEDVNIGGSRNVVEACLAEGVPRLVFTSSASVVYDGSDQFGADERTPYPASYRDEYCRTKSEAEQLIMKAGKDHADRIGIVSVRPHGIFGPRDPQMVPTLVEAAKAGRTGTAIGSTTNLVDFTYIGNVVHGHLLAAQSAVPNSVACGKTYFITNDAPIPFWEFLGRILIGLKYKYQKIRLPYWFILPIAHIAETVAGLFGKTIMFSASRVQLMGTDHWYSCDAAKKDLGYEPLWSMDAGLYLTLQSFQHLRNPNASQEGAAGVAHEMPKSKDEGDLQTYSAAEVAKHNSEEDAWIVVDGKVYDVTPYVDRHPGGEAILRNAGGDATEGFHGPQHPDHVRGTVENFRIGDLAAGDWKKMQAAGKKKA